MTARYRPLLVAPGDWRIQDTTTGLFSPRWHLNLCSAEAAADQLNADDQANQANPWAGRVDCPRCGSSEWTMPYGEIAPGCWICIPCRKHFKPEIAA